jgi:hypothetical protein
MFNESNQIYRILYLVPVPEPYLITVPVPLVKKLRFLQFRFRFRFHNAVYIYLYIYGMYNTNSMNCCHTYSDRFRIMYVVQYSKYQNT